MIKVQLSGQHHDHLIKNISYVACSHTKTMVLNNGNCNWALQRGFTEDTTPLICELIIEEFECENKDLKKPIYIGLLDGKSAFDVVVHANLFRRLSQIGISEQSILLLQNLYSNASSCVKWNGELSEQFIIEQGGRCFKCWFIYIRQGRSYRKAL